MFGTYLLWVMQRLKYEIVRIGLRLCCLLAIHCMRPDWCHSDWPKNRSVSEGKDGKMFCLPKTKTQIREPFLRRIWANWLTASRKEDTYNLRAVVNVSSMSVGLIVWLGQTLEFRQSTTFWPIKIFAVRAGCWPHLWFGCRAVCEIV